jgi:PAS domain S-box-containing protein
MQEKLKSVSKKDINRNWSTKGIAKFAEILRSNNNDLQSLGDAILAELIDYTKANIGCIYVPETEDGNITLKLIAFYAYDTKKHFNEIVNVGEGLIGQTFIEKKTTHLLEIPHDYTHIKSGIGTTIPKSILVVPLKVNEEVYGILEIAALAEFDEEQIEFIEKVGETIAGTIYNVKNAERTKKLLEDSQELTEQMRAQEEEMRQNMEELSATQEEIDRKESQTSITIEAFNNAIATVDIDPDGMISNINGMFAKVSGLTKNSLIGENLIMLVKPEDQNSLRSAIDDVFQTNQTSFNSFDLSTISQHDLIPISMNISYVKSNHAFIICYPSVKSPEKPNEHSTSEIEEELTQNLNMLELTQQTLDNKLKAIDQAFVYLELNKSGEITSFNTKTETIISNNQIDIIGSHYGDLLKLNTSIREQVQLELDENQSYKGIITLEESKNIMLYIEQLND